MFPSRDGNLAINVVGYETLEDVNGSASSFARAVPPTAPRQSKSRRAAAVQPSGELLEYAASIQAGEWLGDSNHPASGPMVRVLGHHRVVLGGYTLLSKSLCTYMSVPLLFDERVIFSYLERNCSPCDYTLRHL